MNFFLKFSTILYLFRTASENILKALSILLILMCPICVEAANAQHIRVGVLKYGTLNWEMDVIRRHKLASENGLKLEIVSLGSPQALLVALQGGAVDIIIGDWLWAARQYKYGRQYYFYPYSKAAGMLVVNPAIGVEKFQQLKGKTIGVAGGKVNKNWVLYRAYARQIKGIDLDEEADIKFAAPPLLNALMMNGRLDAVINFWHYSSELNEKGMTTLLTMQQILEELGVSKHVPLLGWLFKKEWGDKRQATVNAFFATSYSARKLMLESDKEWLEIELLSKNRSEQLRSRLRDDYRKGIPTRFGLEEKLAMNKLFSIVSIEGGKELTDGVLELPEQMFWKSSVLE